MASPATFLYPTMEKGMTHLKWSATFGLVLAVALGGIGLSACAQPAASTKAAPPVAKAAADAAVSTSVMGAFDDAKLITGKSGPAIIHHGKNMGWGWATTTDQRLGGRSTASISLVKPGADDTAAALRIDGALQPGFISPWGGAIWFPGSKPMQAGDLSGHKALEFWARGTPGGYSVMLMAGSKQGIPRYAAFKVGKQWKHYSIPLADSFPGADLKQVYFIAFSASQMGQFQLDLDQVELH